MGKVKASGPLSRRPDNSAFKQQRLPAWSPALSAHTLLPLFYALGTLCVILGVWLLLTVQNTHEIKVDYTNSGTCDKCYELRKDRQNATVPCDCQVKFEIPDNFTGDVFFYYGLINFHQNLRLYMDSRDDAQLLGRKRNLKNPSSYCKPFDYVNGVPIAPCGAIANSKFNDSFVLHFEGPPRATVPLYRRGISWYTDENVKFRNPTTNDTFTLAQAFEGTARPVYWQRAAYELDPEPAQQQRLQQRGPDRVDARGRLPQLQEALRRSQPLPITLQTRPACRGLHHRHQIQLPGGVLPGQEGGGAVHGDLVRGQEPLPAHRLPGHRGAGAPARLPAHRRIHTGGQGWQEHAGPRRGGGEERRRRAI
ncbi:hypothetical protein ACEWY4_027891 [Coilia grayii]|uniref:Uncharacterized protein n=1 Tax=Coilia grayii TaxID=363190 RepID=A0ABD1INE8_9TELE